MRRFSNMFIVAMVLYGCYQILPLLSLHLWHASRVAPAELLVFDLIPEGDQFRMYIVYEYMIETEAAQIGIMASQLSDSGGNPIEAPLLSTEEAAYYEPLLEDADMLSAYLPEPLVFVDAQNPLQSGRLYLAFEQSHYHYGILCIALPIIIWLSSLLIRSFVVFHREPVLKTDV